MSASARPSSASGSANARPAVQMSYNHMIWAAGHGLVVLSTLWTLFKLVTFSTPSKWLYSFAYLGALTAWGIVVFKTLGYPQLSRAWAERLLLDENGECQLTDAVWTGLIHIQISSWLYFGGSLNPYTVGYYATVGDSNILVSLIPFATFSLFHTLTFVRTTFLPPATATRATAQGQAQAPNASRLVQQWVKKNYEPAMVFVAYTEVLLVMPYVTLGALIRRNALILPIFYASFLRLRYYLSPQTRKAFGYLDTQVQSGINHPSCPGLVKQGVTVVRSLILRYAESAIAPAGAAQAQPNAQ